MTLEVDLTDVLTASQLLTNLGSDYSSAVGNISSVSGSSADVFENGTVSGPWGSVVDAIWRHLADSQDNCNDTGRTLIRYINAVCAEDGSHATELEASVEDYNGALENSGLDNQLPDVDPNDPDGVVDEPDHDPAERPEGDD